MTDHSETSANPREVIGANNPPPELDLKEFVAGLPARLKEAHANRIALICDAIAKRINEAPVEIATDEELLAYGEIVGDANDAWTEFDTKRKLAKEDFLNGGRVTDAFFKPGLERLDRIVKAATERATKYNKLKKKRADDAAALERRQLEEAEAEARRAAQVAHEFGEDEETIEKLQEVAAVQHQIAEIDAAPKLTAADVTRVRSETSSTLATTKTEWKFEIEDYSKVDLNALRTFIAPDAIDKAVRQLVKIQKGATKVEGVRVFEDETAQFRR